MADVHVAESSRRKPAKVLDHIEIHPRMGGGHVVKHAYTSYEHEPESINFNADGTRAGKGGGEHIMQHLQKIAGLPVLEKYDERQESETEDEIED